MVGPGGASCRAAAVSGVHAPCRTKTKNAQEAHEAVRPTDAARGPGGLSTADAQLQALYSLVWRRAVASLMAPAQIQQVTPLPHARTHVSATSLSADVLLMSCPSFVICNVPVMRHVASSGTAATFCGLLHVQGHRRHQYTRTAAPSRC